jgi:hypothetical protein
MFGKLARLVVPPNRLLSPSAKKKLEKLKKWHCLLRSNSWHAIANK